MRSRAIKEHTRSTACGKGGPTQGSEGGPGRGLHSPGVRGVPAAGERCRRRASQQSWHGGSSRETAAPGGGLSKPKGLWGQTQVTGRPAQAIARWPGGETEAGGAAKPRSAKVRLWTASHAPRRSRDLRKGTGSPRGAGTISGTSLEECQGGGGLHPQPAPNWGAT